LTRSTWSKPKTQTLNRAGHQAGFKNFASRCHWPSFKVVACAACFDDTMHTYMNMELDRKIRVWNFDSTWSARWIFERSLYFEPIGLATLIFVAHKQHLLFSWPTGIATRPVKSLLSYWLDWWHVIRRP